MRVATIAAASACAVVCSLSPDVKADDADFSPKKGLTVEARLAQSIAPVGVGLSAGTLLPSILGGPPPASIGYRGDGFAVTVGPSIGHIGFDTSATTSSSVWYFGASVLGEIRIAQSPNRRAEGYALVGVNVAGAKTSTTDSSGSNSSSANASDGVSGKPAYGALAGFGVRYWIAQNIGIGAEIGESYLSVPIGNGDSETTFDANGFPTGTTGPKDLRATVLSTFGDLHLAMNF